MHSKSLLSHATRFLILCVAFTWTGSSLAQPSGVWRYEVAPIGSPVTSPLLDTSGNGDHGLPSGGPIAIDDVQAIHVPGTPLPNTSALSFGGADYVEMNSKFLFHQPIDATLEFVFRFTPSGHQSVLWTRTDNTDKNRFNIFVNGNGTFGFDYRTPTGTLHKLVGAAGTGVGIEPGVWTHVAIVRQANVYRLYLNGELKATATDGSPDLPTATGWRVSGRGGYMFKGDVDEVRVTPSALSPSQFLFATFTDVGYGLGGATGTPTLQASGAFASGQPIQLAVGNTAASVPGFLIVGTDSALLPLLGGTLVPSPAGSIAFITQADGTWNLAANAPAALPPGAVAYAQAWLGDATGPFGVTATNGLQMIGPVP